MLTKLISALALCTAATGCVVTEDTTPPTTTTAYGTLSTQWTLDNADDSDVCAYYGIDRVDVAIYDDDGFDVGGAQPFCEDFGVTFDLQTGWYSTEVTLLDAGGYTMSDTVVVVDLRVERNTDVLVDIDFPDASIF